LVFLLVFPHPARFVERCWTLLPTTCLAPLHSYHDDSAIIGQSQAEAPSASPRRLLIFSNHRM
jgi:hypothetical protein